MTVDLRCASCGAELPPAARFCSFCGTPVPVATEVEPPASDVPPIPPELRRRFEEVRAELRGERREVVVLFADLSGFTAMSETMDPEEVTLLMNRLLQDLAATVYEYEGYVDKFIGDAIMALFGAPLAHEDDPERAVLAGLAMIDVVARRNVGAETPLSLRVGINLGEVVAAHLGSEGRLQYTVLGDAVNLASRLEGKAEPDTVLVSQAVYARVASRFGAVELAPLEVKGKAQPVQAFRITGYAGGAGVDGGTPFVGREAELETLAGFLARTAAGEPGALLVEAEAGGGKTRLVREALARAPEIELARFDFSPIRLPGQQPPAGALFAELVGEAADPVARALALLAPRGADHRTGLEGLAREADPGAAPEREEDADPQASRQRRWTALAALLQTASRPRLLWLEDVHWADEAAAELLAFLLPALSHAPVGVLLTARMGESAAWLPTGVDRLTIEPLGEADVIRLLGDRVRDLPPLQRRDLIRRAQGNPLFLEELLRALRAGVGAAGAVPGTVQGLIQSRIDRLAPSEEGLLHMASVLGGRFPLPLLARMYALEAQPAPFDVALGGLATSGFLELQDGREGDGAFHHALMQEVAYGGILLRVRRILHESAARLGEELFADRREAEAPFFAHHYWEAGLKEDAAPHLWSAGRRAAEEYDLHAAERHLKRAAEVFGDAAAGGIGYAATGLDDPEERAGFSERLGWVLLHRGDLDGADLWYHALAAQGREAGRAEWEARGDGQLGLVAWYRGRLDEARKLFERGIATLPAGEERVAADLHNHLGLVAYYRGAPEEAFTRHAEALRLRESIGDRLGMAKSYGNIGNLLLDFREDLDGAEEHYARALELGREVGDRQIVTASLNCLGNVAMERGEWRRAADVFREAQLVLEEIGWPHLRYVTLLSQAVCETALGRIDAALAHLRECQEGDAILEPINRVNLRVFQFDAYLRAYADDEAERALADAARVAEELEVEEREQIRLREGRWLAARGSWPEAARAFAEAGAAARAFNHPSTDELARAHLCRAETYAGRRDVAACATETEAKRGHRALVEYLNADAAAEQGDLERADAALATVVERAAGLGEVALERAAAERLADVRGRLGDVGGAADALARATDALARLEAGLPAELRERFAAHPRVAALRDRTGTPARP